MPQVGTTLVERFLLLVAVTILPLENHIPTVAGMSVSFLIFAALAIYVILNRPRTLGVIWYHPIFIVAYAFIGVSALLEFSSPLSSYETIIRFSQMIVGATCVAVLSRDRSALTAGLYGHIAAALWVSVFLFFNSYGTLKGMGAGSNFHEATMIRGEVDAGFQNNLNRVAFVCIQGAIVAFALVLSGRFNHSRIPLLGISIFCAVATLLTMSRGALVIGLVACIAILYAYGARRYGKVLILVSILGLSIYPLVPDVVWTRMKFTTEKDEYGKIEGRAFIYTTAINHLPEFFVSGVGSGNYFKKWGFQNGFVRRGSVLGAHNAFLQITIMWGVFGLLMFLWIIWCVYRSIPLRCGRDELSLALLGILVSVALYLFVSHVVYDKVYAFAVGMLVGARQGVWPGGIVSTGEVNTHRPGADPDIN
ncbi:O-antigen ligase family protein [Nitrospira sp. BLG_1]|uniref:O-antigen ligase family protein n=1 Tax=Nitrospira sp. BLG_1 TaxID=3395883 RepID=UPI0039BD297A